MEEAIWQSWKPGNLGQHVRVASICWALNFFENPTTMLSYFTQSLTHLLTYLLCKSINQSIKQFTQIIKLAHYIKQIREIKCVGLMSLCKI
jgi:hypothetical protein